MRTPFLKQIAGHYCVSGRNISNLTFVFPSQRAAVFFRKYIAETVREKKLGALICPGIISAEEFLNACCPLRKADNVTLLLDLFTCYNEQRLKAGLSEELLDDFIFWGDTILSDFNDIDKYLANATDVLRNVRELKQMDDRELSYLSPSQRQALERFLRMFVSSGEYKDRFIRIWQLLSPLYESYNEHLLSKGYSYEGARYRFLVEEMERRGGRDVIQGAFPGTDTVVFCGFNALNECEKKIMDHLRDLDMADFCWDCSSPLIMDESNKSSFFMKDNIKRYPQAFPLEQCPDTPEIEVISVPSAIGQVKLLSTLLSPSNAAADERTAVVLPDETLLLPLLNSIPPSVEKINVSMGYPLSSSTFFSLLTNLSQLRLHARRGNEGKGIVEFYHRPVWAIFSNNIFTALCDEKSSKIVSEVKKAHRHYVSASSLSGSPLMDAIFSREERIDVYLTTVLDYIGRSICADGNLKDRLSVELDFAMESIRTVNLLSDAKLQLSAKAYLSLLKTLLRNKSIPFKGEPLEGMQILGPLEMRSLDFDTLFILSCNEGTFPHRNVSASFIPPVLRRGFGLPTYEYQDAVWAYYFYRMIQRPSKVYLLYDNRTEGLVSGEESRYVRQLEYAFNLQLKKSGAKSVPCRISQVDEIPKTQEHIQAIRTCPLSASSLKNYLACPAKFYYSFIEGLSRDEEVAENMDASTIGKVYHSVMQYLYGHRGLNRIQKDYLSEMLSEGRANVRAIVEKYSLEAINSDRISGRDIIFTEMIYKYVCKTLECDKELLERSGKDFFEIKGIEKRFEGEFEGFRLKGFIDRMDCFDEGTIRIVDYKTGKVLKEDIQINDSTAAEISAKIFDPCCTNRPEIAFQFFIYDYLVRSRPEYSEVFLQNSVYSTMKILSETPVNVPFNSVFYEDMCKRLSALLKEMVNPAMGFRRTEIGKTCERCDFKSICSR